MNKTSLFCLIVAGLAVGVLSQGTSTSELSKQLSTFESWQSVYKVSFASNEVAYRSLVLSSNTKKVEEHNADPTQTYKVTVNKFSVYSEAEFAAMFLGTRPEMGAVKSTVDIQLGSIDELGDEDTTRNLQVISVPSSVDWTSVITPVKDQGNCGSCWAFATIAAIEAMYKKVKQVTYSFSEQELVDCVYGNAVNGCDGGWPTKAFRYVKNKQILTEASYPYTGKDQNCKKTRKTSNTNYPISTYNYLNFAGDCLKAQKKLAIQPLAIAVDASRWGSYSSGIFACKSTAINHGVLLVGYDANGNWKIKNSWGTNWGESGYIRIGPGNSCSVCGDLWKTDIV